jgi:hypothetical protein
MLKRASISLAIAALPGLLAYTNVFETLVPAATITFFVLLGFSVLSFLLCLFEDEPTAVLPVVDKTVVLNWDTPETARVAP